MQLGRLKGIYHTLKLLEDIRSIIQRIWNQFLSENSVSRRFVWRNYIRATMSYNTLWRSLSGCFDHKMKEYFYVLTRCRSFHRRRKAIYATMVCRHILYQNLHARRQVICTPIKWLYSCPRYLWVKEHAAWTRQQWMSIHFPDKSRFSFKCYSGWVLA